MSLVSPRHGYGRSCFVYGHVRPLSSVVVPQSVHIPSVPCVKRTSAVTLQWPVRLNKRHFSSGRVPPTNQGGNNGQKDGRPVCPRCGEPFSGGFSTMSKSTPPPPPSFSIFYPYSLLSPLLPPPPFLSLWVQCPLSFTAPYSFPL